MIDVTIIVVSFNTKKYTIDCLKSVRGETSNVDYEIIVVDNGSNDGSVDAIEKYVAKSPKQNVCLIKNSKNLGFAKANNQGIKKAKGKYILLLNSDIKVKRNAIEKLLSFAKEKNNAGVVAARLLNSDGKSIQGSAFKFPTVMRAIKQYWFGGGNILGKYNPKGKEPSEVEAVVMAAFLITPRALNKVGLLDERYFMFFEDIDYCKRVWASGLKIYYLPSARVIHYHGESGKAIADSSNQWRRLIPSSKIYHGVLGHYTLTAVLWLGQKWQRLRKIPS